MFDDFLRGYMECAIWSELDWRQASEDGEANPPPLDDRYTVDDLDAHARKAMESDCRDFIAPNIGDLVLVTGELDGYSAESAGHDFWLTRNGHGAGFWDRDYSAGPVREALLRLSAAAEAYGEANLDSTPEGTVASL